MSTPYLGFSNATLARQPSLKAGDEIDCKLCGGRHVVTGSTPPLLLTYRCGDSSYLAGINGRSVMGVGADCKGEI